MQFRWVAAERTLVDDGWTLSGHWVEAELTLSGHFLSALLKVLLLVMFSAEIKNTLKY